MIRTMRLAAAAFAASLACLTAGPAQAADPGPYVALGDSYTAAPAVPNGYANALGCARSTRNYPALVKEAIGATIFRDESCSGARTEHMLGRQTVLLGAVHAPQFLALSSDTTLVTVGIGGNDVRLVEAATTCIVLGLLAPTGTTCRSLSAKPGGGDRIVDQIAGAAPKIAATLQGIHERAPQARVLIVGYPNVTPSDGSNCYPLVPLSRDDVAYLGEMLRRTNTMLAEQAAANDAEYVDTYEESTGHDMCESPRTRWFEGLFPGAPAFPLHPNARGEESMARSVLRVLSQPPPGPTLSALTRARRVVDTGRAARFTYTLSRAGSVTFTLSRATGDGRYTGVLRAVTVTAGAGDNAFVFTAEQLGRRSGLYRVTATPQNGAPQVVHFRIRR